MLSWTTESRNKHIYFLVESILCIPGTSLHCIFLDDHMINRCCLEGDSLNQIWALEVQNQIAEVFVLVTGILLDSHAHDC